MRKPPPLPPRRVAIGTAPPSRPIAVGGRDLVGTTIMVVEDDALTRKTIREYLVDAGARVLETETADDALHLIASCDAVVAEAFLSSTTGAQLAALVHDHLANLPVLLLSALSRDHLLATNAIAANQPFLRKRFTRDALVHTLADLIARSRTPTGPRERQTPPAPRGGSNVRRP